MWVHVSHVLTTVGIDDVCAVDGQRLIRVDGHQDDSYDKDLKKKKKHELCWADKEGRILNIVNIYDMSYIIRMEETFL